MKLHVLGIRHHGVGSAKNCLARLKEIKPDYIIVEGPIELMESIKNINLNTIKPPVSILLYNPSELSQSSFYPFAEFSPEWQTFLYAQKNEIEYTTADLPKMFSFGIETKEKRKAEEKRKKRNEEYQKRLLEEHDKEGFNEDEFYEKFYSDNVKDEKKEFIHPEGYKLHNHPIEIIANIEGYKDVELWWEHNFEQKFITNPSEHFEAVLEMMSALRSKYVNADFEENELREAFMREAVRKAEKAEKENIVFVCGAWHAPAILEYNSKEKKKSDKSIMKKLPKTKVDTSWIPWLNSRLAWKSGYGAGITAPGWYEHLWKFPKDTGERWLVFVAKVFRKNKIDISTAHIIEAYRLAKTLAAMRKLSRPGLAEMDEAIVATMGMGDTILLNYIKDELTVGKKMGKLPEGLPMLPIQKDFEQKNKTFRFKIQEEGKSYKLDLRTPRGLEKSAFLYQLKLLGIDWGNIEHARTKGTFKEIWRLSWQPELMLNIIDKGIWGNTVLLAAQNYVNDKASKSENIVEITQLIENSIIAQLFDSVDFLINRIQNIASLSTDVIALMKAVIPLIKILRYSDIRKTDNAILKNLIEGLLAKIFISLDVACHGIDNEFANEIFLLITGLNEKLILLENDELTKKWIATLNTMRESEDVASLIRGAIYRIMLDNKNLEQKEVAFGFSKALSEGVEPSSSAFWLEGFLKGSALILILDNTIWNILYIWMQNLTSESFDDLLPILRRTFSKYAPNERKQLGEKAVKGLGRDSTENTTSLDNEHFNHQRAEKALLQTAKLLNI